MTDRWKMNRIGFVNFWLYDEEDFEFVDGKLLLRGQNASGKSITTQSFIPFVLDGDRTPSRLDPFGSSDRRMEYYFLGEDGKEESTGYLFLEFKKEESGEYRTIGIGQRAKRGKAMDFWGFVILDGRRIGHDLWLYKETGSTRIPYDKRELKAALGEENYFTDSQSEYKKHVNQYIFGFRKEEQYEQFIKLLVKVRAPKLSKEFKPTKVYEILNDSLQTLTDEDLRAMVDAMEKMDEIQESLEALNRAFADVKIIRTEYTRYNQYMLAKKAQAYTEKRLEVEAEQRLLEQQEERISNTREEQKAKGQRLKDLEEKEKLARAEQNSLMDMELEDTDRKLELARSEKEEARRNQQRWEEKIQECKEKIREEDRKLQEIKDNLETRQQELEEKKQELEEVQQVLEWENHKKAVLLLETQEYDQADEITKSIDLLKRQVEECQKAILEYEELSRKYDEASVRLEALEKERKKLEQEKEAAGEKVLSSIDSWVQEVFEKAENAQQWKPGREVLLEVEEKAREYQAAGDAGAIQELFRKDYENQRQALTDEKNNRIHKKRIMSQELDDGQKELVQLQNQEELEPERKERVTASRATLEKVGIQAVPFYKAVEFSPELDEAASARLEAQLESAGILDALVVAAEDLAYVRKKCPEFLDTILDVPDFGNSGFSGLTVSDELNEKQKESTARILSNIYEWEISEAEGIKGSGMEPCEVSGTGIRVPETEGTEKGMPDQRHSWKVYLGKDGWFRHGILLGKAQKDSAEFVGILARKKRKEQKIQELKKRIQEITEEIHEADQAISIIETRVEKLQQEYESLPGFAGINEALDQEKQCLLMLQMLLEELKKQEKLEQKLAGEKNQKYQIVLKKCKLFPYGRTKEAYDEVRDAIGEYKSLWQEIRQILVQISSERSKRIMVEDKISQYEETMDMAFVDQRNYSTKVKECDIQIRKFEDYLNRPEIVEKANRLKELRRELNQISEESNSLSRDLAVLADRLDKMLEDEPKQKEKLQQQIQVETYLRKYFEEELGLKLVIDREGRTLPECAKMAVGMLRDTDKNREPADMLRSLYLAYQRHNGSLTNYGTNLEDCFEDADGTEVGISALRKRQRVVSTWNGKKVYLEEFYGILKAAIDETELLIQTKDRELFEDILSQTISQQLTDRIAESRKWVLDMSQLMKDMDTSMGLSFSLDWKPRKAQNDMELDTADLEQILLRDRALLTMEDIEKVAAHFRSKIRMEKQKLEESGGVINYMDLVRDALDYRRWFEFHMYFRRGEEQKKPLTNAAFNRFSGGEKAMAMYVPLFASVNAQYKKAKNGDHPRMIALDEAFAGVDDKNISSMFELVHKLDFDYIMNSQALWGCFSTVKGLRIAELLRPQNSQIVSVIRYRWNGYERILDV